MVRALWASGPFVFAIVAFVIVGSIVVLGFAAVPIMLIALAVAGYHYYHSKAPRTAELRAAAEGRPAQRFPEVEDFVRGLAFRFAEANDGCPVQPLFIHYVDIIRELYVAEDLVNPLPPLPPSGVIDEGRYRDRMLARLKKLGSSEQTLQYLTDAIGGLLMEITRELPPMAIEPPEQETAEPNCLATVPLIQLTNRVPEIVQSICVAFFEPRFIDAGLFRDIREQINANIGIVSHSSHTVLPIHSKLPPEELVAAYLAHTPFRRLFETPLPFNVSLSKQLEHQMVVGGTRWGKSQLMGAIIKQHLDSENSPGIIVLDSQGDFLSKISKLECFDPDNGRLRDRLLIINPEDREAPALNMFDISNLRAKGYKPEDLESVEAEIIHLFSYVFSSMATEMTSAQSGTFSYLVRLLLAMPGSNIHTLKNLLEDKAERYEHANPLYRQYIETLDTTAQD